MTATITTDIVLDHLRAIVAEVGEDYRYPQLNSDTTREPPCLYVRDGKYDCIAARVFGRLGVSTRSLATFEGQSASHVIESLRLDFIPRARIALDRAQEKQDEGARWGDVLQYAEEVVE